MSSVDPISSNRVSRILAYIIDSTLTLLVAAMITIAAMQVLARNLFDAGLVWAEPLLRILVLWVALLGAIVASRHNKHIAIDILSRYLPHRLNLGISSLIYFFTASITSLLAYHSARFVAMEQESNTVAFATVPTWVAELILPIAFGLITVRYLQLSVSHLMDFLRGTPNT